MQVNKEANRSIANANISSYIKKGDDYYIIEQISDIYSPDLFRNEKDKLDVLFNEEDSKYILLCQEQEPKLFKLLQNIYETYQENKKNPFLLYCEETHEEIVDGEQFDALKHGIHAPSENNSGPIVRKLRYMRKVSDPFLIDKKNILKKDNTFIGYDSVAIFCTRLYWDIDLKKIIFVPVYIPTVDFKTGKINENHPLYKSYYDKFIKDIKSNGEIKKENVKGYSKVSKSIQCKSGGYLSPKDKFTLYDVDVLGNKKKRLTWPDNLDIM